MENRVRGIIRSARSSCPLSLSLWEEEKEEEGEGILKWVPRFHFYVARVIAGISRGHVFPGTRACKNRNNSYRRVCRSAPIEYSLIK